MSTTTLQVQFDPSSARFGPSRSQKRLAVPDALRVLHLEMPLTSEKLWRALQQK